MKKILSLALATIVSLAVSAQTTQTTKPATAPAQKSQTEAKKTESKSAPAKKAPAKKKTTKPAKSQAEMDKASAESLNAAAIAPVGAAPAEQPAQQNMDAKKKTTHSTTKTAPTTKEVKK